MTVDYKDSGKSLSHPPARAVVIGASAGALDALSTILPRLPATFAWPLMVVVHLPPDGKSVMTELLQAKCQITVKEAEDKEVIEASTAYFAPPDYHLLVETNFHLSLSNEEPVLFSRPSIDLLFESAADAYGEGLVGIVLTGASADGAFGASIIERSGGTVVAQRPDQAYSSTMPQAALNACSHARSLNLDEIANFLLEVARSA